MFNDIRLERKSERTERCAAKAKEEKSVWDKRGDVELKVKAPELGKLHFVLNIHKMKLGKYLFKVDDRGYAVFSKLAADEDVGVQKPRVKKKSGR